MKLSAASPILLLYEHQGKRLQLHNGKSQQARSLAARPVSQQLSRLNLFDFLCWAHGALGRQQGPEAWPALI